MPEAEGAFHRCLLNSKFLWRPWEDSSTNNEPVCAVTLGRASRCDLAFPLQKKKNRSWDSPCGSVVMKPIRIHEDAGLNPGLTQWAKDPTLLWLWHRQGSYSSDLTPSLGTSICHGRSPKKTK